jgi:arginine repressor
MMGEREQQVLEIFGRHLLIRKDELRRIFNENGLNDGVAAVSKLNDLGYVKMVDSVGSICYTITQNGMRALRSV